MASGSRVESRDTSGDKLIDGVHYVPYVQYENACFSEHRERLTNAKLLNVLGRTKRSLQALLLQMENDLQGYNV